MSERSIEPPVEEALRKARQLADIVTIARQAPSSERNALHAAIDHAVKLARLAQAEKMHSEACSCHPCRPTHWCAYKDHVGDPRDGYHIDENCQAERDRLKRELSAKESG
jgi:hypothetical protein